MRRNLGRGPCESVARTELAPCDPATDVIGPHQSVGEALGVYSLRGQTQLASKRCETTVCHKPAKLLRAEAPGLRCLERQRIE